MAEDRVLAASFAVRAVQLLEQGKDNRVVVHQNGRITDLDLNEVLKVANSPVDPKSDLVQTARTLGIYVGE